MKNISNLVKPLFSVVFLSFFLVSCGAQKPMVSDIKITPSYVEDDFYVTLSSTLELGNVSLPSLSIPLVILKTGVEIGTLSMQTGIGGKNTFAFSLNLSAVTHLNGAVSKLPNGGLLPLIGTNKTIEIPLKHNISIYLSFGDGIAAFGIAVPFKTLDALGAQIGTSALFPVFNIKNVFGAAGIYTSKTAGKNGFGLFADLSRVINPEELYVLRGQSYLKSINYNSIVPVKPVEDKINNGLYKLHQNKTKMKF